MKKVRGWLIFAAALMVALVAVAGWEYTAHSKSDLLSEEQIIKNLGTKLVTENSTTALTKKYAKIVKDGDYDLKNPYIKVNPYKTSPLTALVYFKTPKKAQVSYTIEGKSDKTSITNSAKGYQTKHQLPIVGLYADYENTVKITVKYQSGKKETKTIKIKTGKLPKYLDQNDVKVTKNDKSKMQIGDNELTLVDRTAKQVYAMDADGQIRWYSTNWNQHMFEQLKNGHIMVLNKSSENGKYNLLTETDYLGRIYRQYSFDGTLGGNLSHEVTVIHHDIAELPNGNLLLTVSDGSKYTEDTVVELNRKTGKIVRVLDFKQILPASMYQDSKQKASDGNIGTDWLHINALDYNSKTGKLLVSARNQDLVMQLDYTTGKIEWIFSGKDKNSWPAKYRDKVLSPTGNTKVTGGQHGVYLLDQKGDQETIMLYDNNIAVKNGDQKTSGKYSAATVYQIDQQKKTVTQQWSYGKSLGQANFTPIIGYAQRLANGNTLINFGYKNDGKESNVIEVDADGNQVFNATLSNNPADKTYAYRAYRIQFYPENYHFDVTK